MSETQTMTGEYLVWMWQHYSLSTFKCDTLEDAVGLSEAIQDQGDGSPHCIEGPEGVVAEDVVEAIVAQMSADRRASEAERPKKTHGIKLRSPIDNAHGAWLASYASAEEAEAALVSLRARYGDRVELHEFRS